jgi:acetyl esterase/lipase
MIALTLALALLADASAPPAKLMSPLDFQAIPVKPADARIAYGSDASQFGDLRVPEGRGPHPVVVLVHGGCFRADYAQLRELSPMADALKAEGVATWNIEYRRLGQSGAGWPGTYQDVGRALDYLRTLAREHRLDLSRVVVVGHSAGGHLALWSASRAGLSPRSAIAAVKPFRPRGVVDLAGLPDLRDNAERYDELCGRPVIREMLGGSPEATPDQARDTAAGERLPLGVRQVLVIGEYEDFVPRAVAEAYVAKARASGDSAQLLVVPGAGHFEIAAPTTSAWPKVKEAILQLLGR